VIRTLWVYLNLFVATVVLAIVAMGSALLGIRGGIYDWCARTWGRWILWASNTPLYVHGLENVHLDRPQIFTPNHASWYDIFALAVAIPKRYRFVAKKSLLYIPIFGLAWKIAGHVAIDRKDRAAAIRSLELAGRRIRDERSSIIIFPEGTRSRTGELLRFKKGAFMLALHTGVDIVPVAIQGTRAIMRPGAWRIRPGPIIVRFCEPVRTAGLTEADRDSIMAEVRARIEAALAEEAPRVRVRCAS